MYDDFVTRKCYTYKVETHIIIQNRASVYWHGEEGRKRPDCNAHSCIYMEAYLQKKIKKKEKKREEET